MKERVHMRNLVAPLAGVAFLVGGFSFGSVLLNSYAILIFCFYLFVLLPFFSCVQEIYIVFHRCIVVYRYALSMMCLNSSQIEFLGRETLDWYGKHDPCLTYKLRG